MFFLIVFQGLLISNPPLTLVSSKPRASNKAFDIRISIKNKILVEYKEIKRTRSQVAQDKRRNDR